MTDATTTRRDNDPLSRFLATFPTKLDCSETEYFINRRVFWSEEGESKSSSSSEVHEKIKSAFGDIYLSPLKGILQFWAPIKTTSGRLILSTSDQPFSFAYLNSLRHKYRLCSLKYHSTIIDDDDNTVFQDNPPMIITAPPAAAFLNRFPLVLDLSAHRQDPLVRSALECGLTCSLLLPVFIHPSQTTSSCCVGVVECSVKRSGLVIFNQLKTALERVGLSIYHVQESRPYKNIRGLKSATNEIEEALEIVCESHGLTLAQVWIPFENENHLPSSSSSVENTRMKQKFVVKLIGYRDVSDDDRSSVMNYYDTCDMLPLKLGEGLAGKTLQNYEPLFFQNLKELRGNGLLGLLSSNTKCSCLAICLRSIDTGDLDYAFEFLWPRNRNCFVVLKSLLSTLKKCLPSFKFASGTELGDVADLENSTETGSGFFKTLKRNRLSHWKKCRNVLGVSELQGPKFLKRKFNDLSGSSSDQEDNTANQEPPSNNINQTAYLDDDDEDDGDEGDDDVFIFATYREEITLFQFSHSSTLANVMEEIDEKFNLDPGTYKLDFKFDDGKWAKLNNDEDFKSCLKVCTSAMRRLTVRVLPSTLLKCGYACQQVGGK